MSAHQFDEFERRMRRINRRHTKLSHGYVTAVSDDGLVVAKPRRRSHGATVRGVALLIVVVLILKGVLHAQLGPDAYDERVEKLANGNLIEQAGAWAMIPDPVTLWLSSSLVSLVR